MGARAGLLTAALLLLLGLAGCSAVDFQQARICVAVATAVAPEDTRVSIVSVTAGSGRNVVAVTYSAGNGRAPTAVLCGFEGGPLDAGRKDLVAVRTADGDLSPPSLLFLRRFLIEAPGAVDRAIAETDWRAPPLLPLETGPGSGYVLQQAFNALALAALYGPLALAYSLIYGLTGRINMAFGEIAMIGGFGAVFGIVTASGLGVSGLAAVALAVVVAASLATLWGHAIGQTVFLPLANAPTRPFIVATVGLSLALSEFFRLAQGAGEVWLQPILERPIALTGGVFAVQVTPLRLLIVAVAVIGLPVFLLLWRRSAFGRAWRAVADDPLMARLCGTDPLVVTGQTFMLASALAAVGGASMALNYGGTSSSMGLLIGLKALIACLVGGGTPLGAALGGVVLAALEIGWAALFDGAYRDMAVLAIITLLLVLKPAGLAGRAPALEEGRVVRLS
ncbi:branched-chain amino acid ABC transporter permease [Prosthecomicrobium pneumaticum]|uniref:Branched-chain amino acid transport system permease protein n=1 Tax=Prosthecomicrobium pneumaticum TaxID=81895 RepID=A0A7W9FQ52_9HYPH|nr:branched-chain amino acid ABC transporter permease [Prosthecomicrobium pneumaticum]MBB5754742.1 branched-chain amino acid transport system permease protein [Prosthecomicrobium pneumaticum]